MKKQHLVQVREKIIIKTKNKEYVFESNTPTEDFYHDLYGEITNAPGITLGYLSLIRVIDVDAKIGCTMAPTYERYGFNGIRGSGSCIWDSDYNPSHIWIAKEPLVPREKHYFVTSLPAGITVPRGSPLTVTWEATFNVAKLSASGWLADASIYPAGLVDQLINILLNNRGALSLKAQRTVVKGRVGENYDYTFIDIAPHLDPANLRIILPLTTITATGDILRMTLYSRTTDNIDKELLVFTLPSPYPVRYGDKLGFEIALSW